MLSAISAPSAFLRIPGRAWSKRRVAGTGLRLCEGRPGLRVESTFRDFAKTLQSAPVPATLRGHEGAQRVIQGRTGANSRVILFRFEKSAGFGLLQSQFSPCLASCEDRCDLQETGSRLYDLAQPLAVLESDLGTASKCRPLHSSTRRKR